MPYKDKYYNKINIKGLKTDKMIKMAYDEFKYINKHYNTLINEFGDVEGVKELADEIRVYSLLFLLAE